MLSGRDSGIELIQQATGGMEEPKFWSEAGQGQNLYLLVCFEALGELLNLCEL